MDSVKHIIVGTAGHIDHGKSSLVEALTGTNPDRLEEEKRRGITIDLGFAFLKLDGVRLGFVDVPGHERFVRNMLAGVGGIDLVLLVIAFMLLGADFMTSLEKGEITVRSLAQFWTLVDKPSLDAFKLWLEHTLPSPFAGWSESFLNIYSWAPFGVLGVILAFASSRHHDEG